ncbi:transducin beta-like protein 2 [Syngnathoides biaculeatus]|uniref:transducin beta-like protein 2 n=1 Tax=Syngnathoides biaculeatus TaxID=300417 RepID=UPI002ADD791A|nr:transducin beta-like protein 2 [Syngnathoides biaculeatus]
MEVVALVTLTLFLGGLVALVAFALGKRKEELRGEAEQTSDCASSTAKGPAAKKLKQEKLLRGRKNKSPQHDFSHPLLACSLKGHSGIVTSLDFSSNGKYLASCSDDRTVRIWSTKDFLNRDHKYMRANVELDHATLVCFTPDSRAFITWLSYGDTIRVFKMIKKDDGTMSFKPAAKDFPIKHKGSIINIGMADTGKFLMSAYNDTTINIWNLKGEILASINTNQMTNSYVAVSPCGRFVASCGFTPDVKVWEVCFSKTGEFKEVTRAFELKGHSAGVHAFAFSNDSHKMVTVSKDGTWKLWNTDVEYKKQQDPYLLKTVPCSSSKGSLAALSPDGRVVAISDGCNVALYNASSGELEEQILSIHSFEVTALRFDVTGRFLACSGDKAIRVFHNAPGYRAIIKDMQDMLKKAQNEGMKQRLQQQISDAQKALRAAKLASSVH